MAFKLLLALFWCHNVSAGVAGLVWATVGCLGFDVESLWLSSSCFGATMFSSMPGLFHQGAFWTQLPRFKRFSPPLVLNF